MELVNFLNANILQLDDQVGHAFCGLIVGGAVGAVTAGVLKCALGVLAVGVVTGSFGSVLAVGAIWGATLGFIAGCVMIVADMQQQERKEFFQRFALEIMANVAARFIYHMFATAIRMLIAK